MRKRASVDVLAVPRLTVVCFPLASAEERHGYEEDLRQVKEKLAATEMMLGSREQVGRHRAHYPHDDTAQKLIAQSA